MAPKGESRPKRKNSVNGTVERHSKHLKADLPTRMEDVDMLEDGHLSGFDSDSESARVLLAPTADTAEWQKTIEKVVRNVVSIHFCQTCSFDTDAACSSEATGFVVDAEKGYILTNRHVVSSGPFVGYCIFDNHEEVSSSDTYVYAWVLTASV